MFFFAFTGDTVFDRFFQDVLRSDATDQSSEVCIRR